jgi:surfeit locus 1 family protein
MTPEAARPPNRFPIGLTIATAVAMAILVGLGVWQVQRLAWKEALLAQVAALHNAPAVPLQPVLERIAAGADAGFTRVVVDCPGLGQAPFLELFSVREGGAGMRLISACKVASGQYGSVLVDRGFVSDQVSARPAIDATSAAPIHMIGVLRVPDRATFVTPKNELAANRWYSRDVPAMAKALGVRAPAPLILMAETSTNPGWKALDPQPLPAEISNRHLEYALTWFGLAAALACVYAATLWKRRKS